MRYLRDKISRETQALAQGGQAPGRCNACALAHTPAEGPQSAVRDPDATRAARTALGNRRQQLGEHSDRVTGRADVPDAGCQHIRTVSTLTGRHRNSPDGAFQCQCCHHGKKSHRPKGTAFTSRLEGNSLPPMMKENVISKHTQGQLATQTQR